MTINERVSDELLEQMSAGKAGHGIEYGYAQIRSIARELQQYRAAAEKPVAWTDIPFTYDQLKGMHGTDFANGYVRGWERKCESVSMKGPLYAAPQVTSVPDESAIFDAAIDICRKSDAIDEHAWNRGVLAVMSAFRACLAATAAPAVQAEPLSVTDAEHVASVLEMIGSFEPDDIDSDSVDLRFELNGVDTGSDVSITEYATRGAAIIRQLSGNTEQVSQPYTLTFDQWLSRQAGEIDVDCGCVTTEAFFHWLRVAYEAGNSPAIPEGWTGSDKANAALVMLDRIDTVDPVDDDRIEGIKRIIRELAAAPKQEAE